ncbi:MAG: hypothetical protein KGZ80_10265 [Methylomonas sp.]|nr:hypothetical protein [Methylomonas sp.]PPD21719.1 MAG: hypothetical protein CTY23_04970 [Methylomonas sp.]PPD52573.1 MAG: hypothetical protein CTY11_08655 [Methylomonas sp.]
MKNYDVKFELSYYGSDSDDHEIDLYDVSQALVGFQRSLAITTHLILNGEIITQAPALKGARIYAFPSQAGSWKIQAGILVLGTAAYHVTTAPNNTLLGHLVYSAYDCVISESLGFHVDYNKSLGQLYEESKKNKIKLPVIREAQLDSAIEKCSTAITEIHRPIYKTKTAKTASIHRNTDQKIPLTPVFSLASFQYIIEEYTENDVNIIHGFVSSYNSNTFKGRIYVPVEERPISFILSESVRREADIQLIVDSLRVNALRSFEAEPIEIFCKVQRITTKAGHLKKYKVLAVSGENFKS